MLPPFSHRRRSFLKDICGGALVLGKPLLMRGADKGFVRKSQALPTPRIALPTDQLGEPKGLHKRIAAITTAYWKYSHADDIITKFIEGYGVVGRVHNPHCKVVSLYIDQFPKTDIGMGMAARYSIPLVKTAADALLLKGGELESTGCCSLESTEIIR